jgi:3-mercaptopyruvate sulfurtransferase SseA
LLVLLGVILLLIVAFFFIKNEILYRQRMAEPFPNIPTAAEEQTYPEIPRVSLSDAKAAYDNNAAIFVDVRPAASYQAGHIKGALNIPESELSYRLSELPKNRWIITYCT